MSTFTQSTVAPLGDEAARKVTVQSPLPGQITIDDRSWTRTDHGRSILVGLQRRPRRVLIDMMGPEGAISTKRAVSCDTPGRPNRR